MYYFNWNLQPINPSSSCFAFHILQQDNKKLLNVSRIASPEFVIHGRFTSHIVVTTTRTYKGGEVEKESIIFLDKVKKRL
jgi:hypothetical protein